MVLRRTKKSRRPASVSALSAGGKGLMAHCINWLIDIVLDIANAKKVIGEGWMDKLVSAVACNRPFAQSPPHWTTALAHSTIEDGGDLK